MMLTGAQIPAARVLTLKAGLKLEVKGLTISRGISCYAIIKKEFGFRGSKAKVLEQITEYCEKNILKGVAP